MAQERRWEMLIQGDAAAIPLPDKSVHCVVTSPPYWGLRKYSGEQQRVWGGDADCEHVWREAPPRRSRHPEDIKNPESKQSTSKGSSPELPHTQICQLCDAWYGALGLEPTPELYIEHIVEIFGEVWRVLRDDGVVWANMGDCYNAQQGKGFQPGGGKNVAANGERRPQPKGISQGNLMLMPHRVAIALQADGWIVRNDVVWSKANPMPESLAGWRWERSRTKIREQGASNSRGVGLEQAGRNPDSSRNPELRAQYKYGDDYVLRKGSWRHTRSHEFIFQLVKSMGYFSNQEAVREAQTGNTHSRGTKLSPPKEKAGADQGYGHRDFARYTPNADVPGGRNPRSVLDVPTAPYKGAHYATFPPNLIAPLIRASCPKRCCPECGAPWAPVVEKTATLEAHRNQLGIGPKTVRGGTEGTTLHHDIITNILDYRPTCSCECGDHIPGIVCDVFLGSGTTGAVARELGRRWVGLDISMEYLDQQAKPRALNLTPSDALDDLPMFAQGGE